MDIHRTHMKQYSSLKVGGEGEVLFAQSISQLVNACTHALTIHKIPYILGEGTNTYFGDTLDNYLFIKNEIKGISLEEKGEEVFVTACAGERWDDIVALVVSKNLWGVENLSFIPGTVGAAPVQNIGAYGAELKDVLVSLSAYDINTRNTVEISNSACVFGYRDSLFKKEKNRYCIISITLRLSKVAKPVLSYKPLDTLLGKESLMVSEVRDLVVSTRKSKLPDYKEHPNTGSFFKNPVVAKEKGEELRVTYPTIPLLDHVSGYKIPAAWLIEHVAEKKGVRHGDVGTWPNQPLVLVNYGAASCTDIESFVAEIIEKIRDKTGITIEKEVNFVG
jgi:UDP-N-acetylmuramate dehydrogenase